MVLLFFSAKKTKKQSAYKKKITLRNWSRKIPIAMMLTMKLHKLYTIVYCEF